MNRKFHEDFPITSLLLLLVLGFYVLELVAQQKLAEPGETISIARVSLKSLRLLGGLESYRAIGGREIWRLLSSVFLHAGLIHLAFNAWVLFDLGRVCEPLLSAPKFFVVFVVSGLGGSLATCARDYLAKDASIISIGASGALCGLIGLLLVYAIREGHRELRNALIRWGIYIAILSLLPGISWTGHGGGFLTGVLLGFTVRDYMTSRHAARWVWPAYATGTILTLGLGMAVWNYFSHTLENL